MAVYRRTATLYRPRRRFFVAAPMASCAVTGTAGDGALESQIVAGGQTVILTLTSETWVASGATFNAQRQNIINGLTSAGSETHGWNVEVRDKEVVTAVVRTSNTVVTITLSAAAAYSVGLNETITVTVPGSALTLGNQLIAAPTFAITNEGASSAQAPRSMHQFRLRRVA